MIEIKMDNYYIGVWTAQVTGSRPGDWMAMAWREPDGKWYLKYRFRYHVDDRKFNSGDERRWYAFEWKDDAAADIEQKITEAVQTLLATGIVTGRFAESRFIECRGDGHKMAALLTNPERPGLAHAHMNKEQYEEYERTHTLPTGVKAAGDLNKEGL